MNIRKLVGAALFAALSLGYQVNALAAVNCWILGCWVGVEVVDDGAGGKKLKVDEDGNVQMHPWTRLVAITWTLRTPGYEFRSSPTEMSIAPKATTPANAWNQQILPGQIGTGTIFVTNWNRGTRQTLYYDLTVYAQKGTPGPQVVKLDPAIMNDP